MTGRRNGWAERLQQIQRIRAEVGEIRRDAAENRRRAREPIDLLYVRCDGCGDVTSHLSTQRVGTITWTASVVAPPEIVCDLCEHAQPRTVGDEVASDAELVCAGFTYRRWRTGRSRHRCARPFMAPSSAARPRCQWCLSIQPERGGPERG